MATEDSKKLIQNMYIAYYGRPADSAGLEHWVNEVDTKGSEAIIDDFGTSPEYTQISSGLNNRDLINRLYQFLYNRDAEEAGLNFYLGKLEDTTNPWSLSTIALRIFSGSLGNDKNTIDNKVELANYFTNQHDPAKTKYDLDGVQALRATVDKVTADTSSLTTLKGEIDQYITDNAIATEPPPQQEPQPQVISGTDGADTFIVPDGPEKKIIDLRAGGTDTVVSTHDATRTSLLNDNITEVRNYDITSGDKLAFGDETLSFIPTQVSHIPPYNIDDVPALLDQGIVNLHIENGIVLGEKADKTNISPVLPSWSAWETLINDHILDINDVYSGPSVDIAKDAVKNSVFGFHFNENTVVLQIEDRHIKSAISVTGVLASEVNNFDFFLNQIYVEPTAFSVG